MINIFAIFDCLENYECLDSDLLNLTGESLITFNTVDVQNAVQTGVSGLETDSKRTRAFPQGTLITYSMLFYHSFIGVYIYFYGLGFLHA